MRIFLFYKYTLETMKTSITTEQLNECIDLVRSRKPLIHNITNYVVMGISANSLLAIGASPVMAHWKEEMKEMISIADALVLNIGTLDGEWIESMKIAGLEALHRGIPVVLDPVGAGATSQRTAAALELIDLVHPTIIRGNGSEIMALVSANIKSHGVDSTASSHDALSAAEHLARTTGAVVVISGEVDYITDGHTTYTVEGGSEMMTRVTGMGCTSTALVGALAAVTPNPLVAATAAMAIMSLAGERAASYANGSGSLQTAFIDELYNLTSNNA